MYFVRYQPLKERLRESSVSDSEALPYLIADVALTALLFALPQSDGYNFWDGVSGCLSVATAVGGVLYAYKKNGGRDGYDFIQKYVVLGWVVGVRFLIAFVPIALVLLLLGIHIGMTSCHATHPYDVVMIFLAEVIYVQRVGRHVGDTVKDVSEQAPPDYRALHGD